jgi:hypothetical protein
MGTKNKDNKINKTIDHEYTRKIHQLPPNSACVKKAESKGNKERNRGEIATCFQKKKRTK